MTPPSSRPVIGTGNGIHDDVMPTGASLQQPYHADHDTPRERARAASLMAMLPEGVTSVLDIGARDGFITLQLADRVPQVTALDLEMPAIDHPRISCVRGNAARLPFADAHFDLVFCAEVLEHIPGEAMVAACREITRVARRYALIGVPYRQDLRVGRVTCANCGRHGPAWGHLHSFDEARLIGLFDGMRPGRIEHVGVAELGTNALSTWLADRAGNPYGTYTQDEGCVYCGARLRKPAPPTFTQRALNRLGVVVREWKNAGRAGHANWIHILFEKRNAA